MTVGLGAPGLRRAVPHARPVARVRGARVLAVGPGVLVGVRRGRVAYLAVYDPRVIAGRARLMGYLERAT